MHMPREHFIGTLTAAVASSASPKPHAKTKRTVTSEIGDAWYQKRQPDPDTARNGPMFFKTWDALRKSGDVFVKAFVTEPELRKEYYRIRRSWDESSNGQFGEKWCALIEHWVPSLTTGVIQRDDFASFHKYLFWTLVTSLYQQTRTTDDESFPTHDDPPNHGKRGFFFHGVPNGDQSGGLPAGTLGSPPP